MIEFIEPQLGEVSCNDCGESFQVEITKGMKLEYSVFICDQCDSKIRREILMNPPEVFYFCDCESIIEFKDESQWREHMINVHGWDNSKFDAISAEMQNTED